MFLAVVLMLLSMLSISAGATLAKGVLPLLGGPLLTTLRLALASGLLLIYSRPWQYKLNGKAGKLIFLYGAALGIMNLCFYLSLKYLPLGIAMAFEFIGPMTLSLLATRQRQDFIWILSAIMGVALLMPISKASAHLNPLGIALALIAGICWALYSLAGRRLAVTTTEKDLPGAVVVTMGMCAGTVVMAPIGLSFGNLTRMNSQLWMVVLGVALLSGAIPYTLEMAALKRLSTKTYGILISLEPAMGALSGYLFLSEHLSGLQVLAIALIVIASAGSTYTESQRERLLETVN
jgi:inner membrane transporter RhtA